jgi:Uma2 family endonuclease
MSTVRKSRRRRDPRRDDPFFYGWRDTYRVGADGRKEYVQVPLTPEDVLHPQEDDHIMLGDAHSDDTSYLKNVLKIQLSADVTARVFNDLGIYWDIPELGHHSPDISVIFGIRRARRNWTSFYVAKEGVRPSLLIEVTSPSTRKIDFHDKRRDYYQAGVPYYVIADEQMRRGQRSLRILGYRRGQRGYERLALNRQGRLWLEPVGLWLGQEEGRVACYDTQGNRLGDYAEMAQARQAEEQARAAAEERVRQLEAELRRLRGNHS